MEGLYNYFDNINLLLTLLILGKRNRSYSMFHSAGSLYIHKHAQNCFYVYKPIKFVILCNSNYIIFDILAMKR